MDQGRKDIRVLFVDDDNALGIAFCRSLSRRGLEAVWSSSPIEALDRLSRERFDVVVTDYNMSPLTGTEFLERARAQGVTTPFMLVTAVLRSLSAEQNGFDALIEKPWESDSLVDTIIAVAESNA